MGKVTLLWLPFSSFLCNLISCLILNIWKLIKLFLNWLGKGLFSWQNWLGIIFITWANVKLDLLSCFWSNRFLINTQRINSFDVWSKIIQIDSPLLFSSCRLFNSLDLMIWLLRDFSSKRWLIWVCNQISRIISLRPMRISWAVMLLYVFQIK